MFKDIKSIFTIYLSIYLRIYLFIELQESRSFNMLISVVDPEAWGRTGFPNLGTTDIPECQPSNSLLWWALLHIIVFSSISHFYLLDASSTSSLSPHQLGQPKIFLCIVKRSLGCKIHSPVENNWSVWSMIPLICSHLLI